MAAVTRGSKIRLWLYGAGVIILCVAIAVVGIAYIHVRRNHDIEKSKASFDLDLHKDLHTGFSKLQVSLFLDKHSFVYKELGQGDFLQADSWYLDAQHTIQGYSRYITLSDPICRIFVEFKFSATDTLIAYRDHLSCKESFL